MAQANKSKAPSNEVATNSGGAVTTTSLPSFMQQDVGKGTENLGAGDYEMPRLALMQGLSEEVQSYDGVKIGDFFHTLAEVSLGNSVRVIPVYISKRYVLWRPRWDGGGILARSDDAVTWQPGSGEFDVKLYKDSDKRGKWKMAPTVAASGLDQWGSYDPTDPKSPPAATLCYVIVCIMPDYPELGPVALMLQRTSIGPARKLMGKLKLSRAPSYGLVFNMSSTQDDRNGEKFQNYRFTSDGFVEDEALYTTCRDLHEKFKADGVQIRDIEGAQEDGTPAANKEDVAEKADSKY